MFLLMEHHQYRVSDFNRLDTTSLQRLIINTRSNRPILKFGYQRPLRQQVRADL